MKWSQLCLHLVSCYFYLPFLTSFLFFCKDSSQQTYICFTQEPKKKIPHNSEMFLFIIALYWIRKGIYCTICSRNWTNKLSSMSRQAYLLSWFKRQLHFIQLEASHIHSRSKSIPRKDRTSSLSITQKAFETPRATIVEEKALDCPCFDYFCQVAGS